MPEDIPKTGARGFRVTGRVQGVGFRWWTTRQAKELGLRGTVRNCEDGSVELRLAGPDEALSRMEARLHEGPPTARVERVEPVSAAAAELPDDFRIVR